ncbi:hypothetical protein NN3_35780 [Nocardia neocaledoniensis NBRC 108232]|uniref:Uncharacterized protein n=1 Tax=Nocardia neocaledoniensis TaxID=236511 RepID=A0A317NSY6_9NOCA|nr:hypothetical protein [Nocardia neocaledoniensis]PWV78097.1 hypothetical protein DFR69_103704 [Nocardia neocaledoniensis]GEM32571.1 hypothetical protein NN3_35780 [Nocardia neocaledoniensis NBRC 108232]
MGHPQPPNPYHGRPGQPMPPGQPYPGQYPQGQPYPQQPYQPMPGQPYPQGGPMPGQPYPQYGAQGGYGQPTRPSGGSGGKVALFVGGAVVLIALAVGGWFLFAGGGGGIGGGGYDTPREAAQAWVDQKGDLEDLVCASDRDEIAKYKNKSTPTGAPSGSGLPKTTTTLKSVDVPSGSDSGTFTTAMSMEIMGQKTTTTATYKLVEEDGGWKVCGILNPVIETE